MHTQSVALTDALAELASERAVEVGIGNRPGVAEALTERGRSVAATDIVRREVPADVEFVHDDLIDPDPAVYADAELVYALNCPPELQRPLVDVAAAADATWAFTTLGNEPVIVDADRRTLADDTLFAAPSTGGPIRR